MRLDEAGMKFIHEFREFPRMDANIYKKVDIGKRFRWCSCRVLENLFHRRVHGARRERREVELHLGIN